MADSNPSELGRVRDLVEMLSSRKYIIRFLFHTSDRRAIEDCKTRITKAFQRLEVSSFPLLTFTRHTHALFYSKLGHMIRSEEKLVNISGGVGMISRDVRDLHFAHQVKYSPDRVYRAD